MVRCIFGMLEGIWRGRAEVVRRRMRRVLVLFREWRFLGTVCIWLLVAVMIPLNVSPLSQHQFRLADRLSFAVWDTRSLRKPLFTASFLPNAYPETNIIFSPDDKTILTGLSVQKDSGIKGEIVVLNREGLTEKKRIPVSEGSVIKVAWHSRINQVCLSLHVFDHTLTLHRSCSQPLLSEAVMSSTRRHLPSTARSSRWPRCHVKKHGTKYTPRTSRLSS